MYRLAKEIAQYAEDAKTHDEPWKLWEHRQVFSNKGWGFCDESDMFFKGFEFRRRPKTITINDIECPDDFVREPLKNGDSYWVENITSKECCEQETWVDDSYDPYFLEQGIIHTTKSGAITACKARHHREETQ